MNIVKTLFVKVSLFSFLFLLQCQTEVVTPESAGPNPFEAKMDDIKLVAQNYWKTSDNKENGRISSTNEIKEIETVADEDNSPLFYVINYKTGGFIIVSSDLRTMPVLAYSETGDLDSKQAPSVNGLKIWFDFAKNQIKSIKKETYGADSIVTKEWRKYAAIKIVKSSGGRKTGGAKAPSAPGSDSVYRCPERCRIFAIWQLRLLCLQGTRRSGEEDSRDLRPCRDRDRRPQAVGSSGLRRALLSKAAVGREPGVR